MSDLLVHWAIFDDCRRLCQHDRHIEPLFARIIASEAEYARLGALSRGGSKFVPAVLHDARPQKEQAAADSLLARKLAFALGGITHYAADFVMKPLMSQLAQADWNATHHQMQGRADGEKPTDAATIREISAYYDTHVFRQVYLSGQAEPFNQFLVANNASAPGQALEAFIRSLFQRALLASHTLSPDTGDIHAWLERLIQLVQPLYLDIALYTQVFNHPDPAKMLAYQVETTFYQPADPIILCARAIQNDQGITAAAIEHALAETANASAYGRALALAQRRLRQASAFWRGETDETPHLKQ